MGFFFWQSTQILKVKLKSTYNLYSFYEILTFGFFSVAFRLYDLDKDDKISRDELLQVRLLLQISECVNPLKQISR